LDTDAFGTLWSLSKADGKLFLTNTKRVDKKRVLACAVYRTDGSLVDQQLFVNDVRGDDIPWYLHGIAGSNKFYVVYKLGNRYYLKVIMYT
jgi:hypothetical protein